MRGEELIFVAQEGRQTDLVGIKLLCMSIARYEPGARVILYVSQSIIREVCQFISSSSLHIEIVEYEVKDWSCKPLVLLDALQRTGRRVTWIDSDVLIIGKASVLSGLDKQAIAIAEESSPGAHRFVKERQRVLGLPEAPHYDTTLSSAILSVTEAHEPMLKMWSDFMDSEVFISEQRLDKFARTLFYGDQEVLEAILCAYREFPLRILQNDLDLLQATWYEKPRKIKGRIPFAVHATGDLKPWKPGSRLNQEMFPYFEAARDYLHVLTSSEQAIFNRRSQISTTIKFALGGFTTYRATRRLAGKVSILRTLPWKLQKRKSISKK
jgi:hypothetical protein